MCYVMRIASHIGETMALARTNLTLPEELLAEVDALAGPRGRSRYVAEAVAQRVKRDRLGAAIRSTAGVMATAGTGMSRAEVSAWVEQLRSEGE
jgi:metal-responsive CopG/Arc/MetJ family transcriptional regulator